MQARGPGESTAPAELADLISSIREIGLLQPVLVEEFADEAGDNGADRHHLVAGERRLRSMRWGAAAWPDEERFASLPAVVCPGPLSEEERRTWQLVENLAREDLRPGELAGALLFERCAVLTERLAAAGREVPDEVLTLEDPAERFRALERLRGADAEVAAPWGAVLRRLGVQMSSRKARPVVAAFRAMPRELSADMDAHRVALTTRQEFLRLGSGHEDAAAEIWQAVKERGRTDLLSAAVHSRLADGELDANQAVEEAAGAREAANASRAAKLAKPAVPDATDATEGADGVAEQDWAPEGEPATSTEDGETADIAMVADAVADAALAAMRELLAQLRAGHRPAPYAAGSLSLLLDEARTLLDRVEGEGR